MAIFIFYLDPRINCSKLSYSGRTNVSVLTTKAAKLISLELKFLNTLDFNSVTTLRQLWR